MRSTIIRVNNYYDQHWQQTAEPVYQWQPKKRYLMVKRTIDISISLVVILLIYPWLFPLVMLLIRLDSKGPVFFRQARVGFLEKIFWCYKFRTMYVNDSADSRQAVIDDPRITRIGAFLRKTGLDELPQFVNVLKGDMSLVGPRPHMLKDSSEFADLVPDYKFRHLVRPGITGLSQVRGYRGPAISFTDIFRRYQWDAYYVRNNSFFVDLKIIIETAGLMLISVFVRDRRLPENYRDDSQELDKQAHPNQVQPNQTPSPDTLSGRSAASRKIA